MLRFMIIFLLCICMGNAYGDSINSELNQIVIIMKYENNKLNYYVDSKIINSGNLFRQLGSIYGKNARNTEIAVLIHENVPIMGLRDLLGIVGKIGYKRKRQFFFDDDHERIVEISLGEVKQYTVDPALILKK